MKEKTRCDFYFKKLAVFLFFLMGGASCGHVNVRGGSVHLDDALLIFPLKLVFYRASSWKMFYWTLSVAGLDLPLVKIF